MLQASDGGRDVEYRRLGWRQAVVPLIRLLIVDDHLPVRRGLEQLFGTVPGVEVVGVASDGAQAVTQADRLRPDVILMDILMPKTDGIEATRQISEAQPGARIVILTVHGHQARMRDALQAGAASYMSKYSDPEDVIRAVQTAYTARRRPPIRLVQRRAGRLDDARS